MFSGNPFEKPILHQESLPKRVLEIGAGMNPLREFIDQEKERYGGPDIETYVCVDQDARQINRLVYSYLQGVGIDGYVAAEMHALPFANSSFDILAFGNVFGDGRFVSGRGDNGYNISPAFPTYVRNEEGDKSVDALFAELSRVLSGGGELTIVEEYSPLIAERFLAEHEDIWKKYFTEIDTSTLLPSKRTRANALSGFVRVLQKK